MPPLTFDGRSLIVGGRRIFVIGARCEYALCPSEDWENRLAAIRQQGFNTVLCSCPWSLHESSKGTFDFEEDLDVSRFLRLAHAQGLKVIIRIGPAVGRPFDGSGMPSWFVDNPEIAIREQDPEFMNLASRWYGKLADELSELQADKDEEGPLIAVQVEHEWTCGAIDHGQEYLGELFRLARERGFSVPIITANGFWQDLEHAIETWVGWDDLLANLRQVRSVQPNKPRLAVLKPKNNDRYMGEAVPRPGCDSEEIVKRIGAVVSTGAQPILDDAVRGVHSRANAGADNQGRLASMPVAQSLLDETGEPTPAAGMVKRITSFCSNFSGLLADLEPDYQPVMLDIAASPASAGPAIVGMRSDSGKIAWVFRGGAEDGCTMLMEDGVRIPVTFGDAPLTWIVMGADLHGGGRLDYANVPPYAVVDRRMLVLQGPPKTMVFLSINGAPLELAVPVSTAGGGEPLCVQHNGTTIVLCNQEQIDKSIVYDGAFYFGVRRIDQDGVSHAASGVKNPMRIDPDGSKSKIDPASPRRMRKRQIDGWEMFDEPDPRAIDNPRGVKVDGDLGLSSVGAAFDYGWFVAEVNLPSSGTHELRFLGGLPDASTWLDGESIEEVQDGRLNITSTKGEHVLSLLARHAPRRVDGYGGLGTGDRPGGLVIVSPLKGVTEEQKSIDPVDPFRIRRFVNGAADGQRTGGSAKTLSFTHRRKSSLLVELSPGAAGLLLLNGEPIAWHDGLGMHVELVAGKTEGFKSGANTVAFAPLENATSDQKPISMVVFEITTELITAESWRFRRWEQPDERIGSWSALPSIEDSGGRPRWYRATVPTGTSGWGNLHLEGLSRGRAWLDGVALGSYEVKLRGNGGSSRGIVTLPVPILDTKGPGQRTLLLFDEDGMDPTGVSLRM